MFTILGSGHRAWESFHRVRKPQECAGGYFASANFRKREWKRHCARRAERHREPHDSRVAAGKTAGLGVSGPTPRVPRVKKPIDRSAGRQRRDANRRLRQAMRKELPANIEKLAHLRRRVSVIEISLATLNRIPMIKLGPDHLLGKKRMQRIKWEVAERKRVTERAVKEKTSLLKDIAALEKGRKVSKRSADQGSHGKQKQRSHCDWCKKTHQSHTVDGAVWPCLNRSGVRNPGNLPSTEEQRRRPDPQPMMDAGSWKDVYPTPSTSGERYSNKTCEACGKRHPNTTSTGDIHPCVIQLRRRFVPHTPTQCRHQEFRLKVLSERGHVAVSGKCNGCKKIVSKIFEAGSIKNDQDARALVASEFARMG
jgi:hypothetical protein